MRIIRDLDQGTTEWLELRLGSIGGSEAKKAVAGKSTKTRVQFMYQKVDEILSGKLPASIYYNDAMRLGNESEHLSREAYEFITGNEVEEVAMIKLDDHKHYSPDGLVGENGLIEIKNTNGPSFCEIIHKDKIPSKYLKQLYWGLYVSGREWIDYVQACWVRDGDNIVARYPDKQLWIKRVYRDDKKINKLVEGVDEFINEMLEATENISCGSDESAF